MTDTVTIVNAAAKPEPTLEEQAKAAGIDTTAETVEAPVTDMVEPQAEPEVELPSDAKSDEAEPEANTEEASEDEPKADEAVEEAVEKAGLDLDELSEKFWANDGLDDSDYESLEKAGYPRKTVDEYIEGQKAIVELATAKVYLSVGGEQNYQDMITWAKGNLTEAEIASYDKAVAADDMNDVLSAVKGLKARFDTEHGVEPTRRVGGGSGRGDSSQYESVAQLQVDMRDPRYKTDSAFRAKVEAKLGRSDIL